MRVTLSCSGAFGVFHKDGNLVAVITGQRSNVRSQWYGPNHTGRHCTRG